MFIALRKIGVWVLPVYLLLTSAACSTLLFKETRKYIQYPIQSGDTLHAISKRFKVPIDSIATKNSIRDPKQLRIGQMLKIPYTGQDLSRKAGESTSARASYGGLAVKGSSSDRSNLKQVDLGRARHYVGKLKMPSSGRGTHISSKFGRRWLTFHEGIDIAGPIGTRVGAAHGGTVVYSGSSIRGYGNMVVVKGDGLITVYGHNKRNVVRVGDKVSRGEKIAELGMSGKATGPHVHFETRVQNANGRYVAVNPLAFFQ